MFEFCILLLICQNDVNNYPLRDDVKISRIYHYWCIYIYWVKVDISLLASNLLCASISCHHTSYVCSSSSNFIPNRKQSAAYMNKDTTSVNQYTLMFCWWSPEKPKAHLTDHQQNINVYWFTDVVSLLMYAVDYLLYIYIYTYITE